MDLLRHLEMYEAVADEGHFGRAAQRLGMAQPPLSQAVKRLENHLGCRLFERTATGAVLTAAGVRLREPARRLRAQAEELPRAALGVPSDTRDVLVDPGVPAVAIASVAARAARTGRRLRMIPMPTAHALRRVREDAGLAIVLGPFRTAGLRTSGVARIRMWESVIAGSEEASTMIVHPDLSPPTERALTDSLRSLGVSGRISVAPYATVCGQLAQESVRRAVTFGSAAWPEGVGDRCMSRPLPMAQISVPIQVVMHRDTRNPVNLEIFDMAYDELRQTLDG